MAKGTLHVTLADLPEVKASIEHLRQENLRLRQALVHARGELTEWGWNWGDGTKQKQSVEDAIAHIDRALGEEPDERPLGGPVEAQCIACGTGQRRMEGIAFACISCGNTNPPPYRTDEQKETGE